MTPQPLSKKERIQRVAVVVLALYCAGLLVYFLAAPWINKARAIGDEWDAWAIPSYRFTTSRSAYAQGRVLIVKDNCQDGCATYVFVEDPTGKLKSFGEYNSEINRMLYELEWSNDKTIFAVRSVTGLNQPTLSDAYDFTKHEFVAESDIANILAQRGSESTPFDNSEATNGEPQWSSLSAEQFEAMKSSAAAEYSRSKT